MGLAVRERAGATWGTFAVVGRSYLSLSRIIEKKGVWAPRLSLSPPQATAAARLCVTQSLRSTEREKERLDRYSSGSFSDSL